MQMVMGGGYGYSSGYGSGYGSASSMEDMLMLALILAIVGTVLSFIFITPVKKRAGLPKFFQVVHDVFNFNGLIIEKILKAIYIFFTLYLILESLFLLFQGGDFLSCLLSMVLGPVIVRIFFELIMMSVLLVKNVIQINKKLKDQNDKPVNDGFGFDYTKYSSKEEQPQYTQNTENAATYCPHCGGVVSSDSVFCPHCGQSVQ